MAHYVQNLQLIKVLDEIRDAYVLAKESGYPGLPATLMQIRRRLLEALHESLNLYGENAELHQQLSEAQAEIRRLRASMAEPTLRPDAKPEHGTRKLS